jgi:molybdate transport system substrate-binding protein
MKIARLFIILILLTSTAGCADPGKQPSAVADSAAARSPDQEAASSTALQNSAGLVVFAAASLTGAFKEIGRNFEAANPGVKVSFNFAGSQILRTQLEQGAAADVFVSADERNMDQIVADQLVEARSVENILTNSLIVILPAQKPGNVKILADLARPGLKLILADGSVPAGNYARQVLAKISQNAQYGEDFSTKVLANVVSNETDVKQVVAKVELGEGDAGIVYVSDAVAAPDLLTLTIPAEFNVIATYPIAVLANAHQPRLANLFVQYVCSAQGMDIMKKWGFSPASQ